VWARPCLIVLLAPLLAGCGARAESPAPAAGWTTYRDAVEGYSVRYPAQWQRARTRLTPHLANPREILTLATFPLRPGGDGCAHMPTRALRDLGPRDVLVTVQERAGSSAGFPGRPAHFSLSGPPDRTEAQACAGRGARFAAYGLEFAERHRGFHVIVALGSDAPERSRADAVAVLDSLRVRPAHAGVGIDPDFAIAYQDPRWRLAFTLPLSWHVARRPQTRLEGERLAMASFRLPAGRPDPGCTPARALRAMPARGAFVFVFEYPRPGPRLFARMPRRPTRFRLPVPTAPECLPGSRVIRFREAGRAFQVHVHLGARAGAGRRRQVLSVLNSLRVRR
jgi:hypothetical protein